LKLDSGTNRILTHVKSDEHVALVVCAETSNTYRAKRVKAARRGYDIVVMGSIRSFGGWHFERIYGRPRGVL
jgi:hypothetical protein